MTATDVALAAVLLVLLVLDIVARRQQRRVMIEAFASACHVSRRQGESDDDLRDRTIRTVRDRTVLR